jgi:G3E family GTPase
MLLTACFGAVDGEQLFDMGLTASLARSGGAQTWLAPGRGGLNALVGTGPDQAFRHDAQISSFAIVRERPIRALALTLLLEVLAEHCGGDLLRLKAIVNVAECPGRPAVVHGVQHVFHPPTWLERWPSRDHRSRLVFIVRAIPRPWIEALLVAIENEVGEVIDQGKADGKRGEKGDG